jgi:hypothetical protein
MFWGPLTFFGFCFSLIGYISTHPELLANIREQPQTIEDTLAEEEASNNPISSETPILVEGKPAEAQNWNQLYQSPTTSESTESNPNAQNPTEQNGINENTPQAATRKNSSSIFQPLLPEIKSNTNTNTNSGRIEPVKPSSGLPQNHLQQAIENNSNLSNYNLNNSATVPTTSSRININNQTGVNQNQSGNTGDNYSNQTPANNYPVPYNTNTYNNYPAQSQPAQQPVIGGYQLPYNNYPNQSSNIPTQPNYNSNNSNGQVTPGTFQIQPSINGSNNYY